MDIGVVIVTYNRLEKLKTALESFRIQTHQPAYILVVNNASTDGTKEFLEQWKAEESQNASSAVKRIVVQNDRNLGGSGGFCCGEREAMKLPADWVWLSDDDAFPYPDALEKASEYLDRYKKEKGNTDGLSAVCALVMNNGLPDPFHCRSIVTKGIRIAEHFPDEQELSEKYFLKNTLSYVGCVISVKKLRDVGTDNPEYFIYYDDTEHGLRLSQCGKIICITDMRINHDTPPETPKITWKDYYKFRNMTDMYRRHFKGICFGFFALKVNLKIIFNRLSGRKNLRLTILETAFRDAMNGKFGLHEVYKPGWKA